MQLRLKNEARIPRGLHFGTLLARKAQKPISKLGTIIANSKIYAKFRKSLNF
jgi:hypothetical protein